MLKLIAMAVLWSEIMPGQICRTDYVSMDYAALLSLAVTRERERVATAATLDEICHGYANLPIEFTVREGNLHLNNVRTPVAGIRTVGKCWDMLNQTVIT